MAYALKFPKDVTDIIMSMRDWRYEMVLAGGKTPSARCMPEPVPEHKPFQPCTVNMTLGKLYMQRFGYGRYEGDKIVSAVMINIWKGTNPSRCSRGLFWTQGDGVVVQGFHDICSANHKFG
jgi:hypothetical protein